jgi:dihydroflavonol-4-reductase
MSVVIPVFHRGLRLPRRNLTAVRVLVTGATGFVGSHTVVALHRDGHDLRLLARTPARAVEQLTKAGIDPATVEVVRGDITDAESVQDSLNGCDAVVHAAAVVGIDGSKAAAARSTNELGTRNVLGGAVALGLDPVIYVSSISALFDPKGALLLTPESPVAPATNAYAESKAASERYARELQGAGHPVVCVYPGGVLGPDDPGLSEAMRGALIWRQLTMADIDSGYLLIDVRDVAAIIAAALRPGHGARRYLAGHHYLRWRELGRLVAEVTGRPVLLPPIPGMLLRALGRVGDVVHHVIPFSFPLSYEAMDTATRMVPMDDRATVEDLGMTFHEPIDTLRDTYRWLYESGRISAWWVPALAN